MLIFAIAVFGRWYVEGTSKLKERAVILHNEPLKFSPEQRLGRDILEQSESLGIFRANR